MSDVTQRKTAAADGAAQRARTDREARRAAYNKAAIDRMPPPFVEPLDDRHAGNGVYYAPKAPFRGSEDEGYSDQRSNQAEQRHALKVKGVGEGLKGYKSPQMTEAQLYQERGGRN